MNKKAQSQGFSIKVLTEFVVAVIFIIGIGAIALGLMGFFVGDSTQDNTATLNSLKELANYIDAKKNIDFKDQAYTLTIQPNHVLFTYPPNQKSCPKKQLVFEGASEAYPECSGDNQCLCTCELGRAITDGSFADSDDVLYCEGENMLCVPHNYQNYEAKKLSYTTQDDECVQLEGSIKPTTIGIIKKDNIVTICEPGEECVTHQEKHAQDFIFKVLSTNYRVCIQDILPRDQLLLVGPSTQKLPSDFTPQEPVRCDDIPLHFKIPTGTSIKLTPEGDIYLYKAGNFNPIKWEHIFHHPDSELPFTLQTYDLNQPQAYTFFSQQIKGRAEYKNDATYFMRSHEKADRTILCFLNEKNECLGKEYELWLTQDDEIELYDLGYIQHGVALVGVKSSSAQIKLKGQQAISNNLVSQPNTQENCVNPAPEFIELDYPTPAHKSYVWVPEQARCGGTVPVLIPLHGRRSNTIPAYNIYLDNEGRDKQFNLIAQEYIDQNKAVPLLIAAPMDNHPVTAQNEGLDRWESKNFNINTFLTEVTQKISPYNLAISSVSVMGHSNGLCNGGVKRAAENQEMYVVAMAEGTCKNYNYAKDIVEKSKNKDAIFIHMYNSRGFSGDVKSSEYLRTKSNYLNVPVQYENMYTYARKHPTLNYYSFSVDKNSMQQGNFILDPLPEIVNSDEDYTIHGIIPGQLFKEVLDRFYTPQQNQQQLVS